LSHVVAVLQYVRVVGPSWELILIATRDSGMHWFTPFVRGVCYAPCCQSYRTADSY